MADSELGLEVPVKGTPITRALNDVLFQRLCPPGLQRETVLRGKRNRGTKFILIACFPKSGSSFLSAAIGQLPGFLKMAAVPSFGRREQELDEAQLMDLRGIVRNVVFAHHVRHSMHTQQILDRYPFHLVVLTRNLRDAVRSLDDHLSRESTVWPMAFLDKSGLDYVSSRGLTIDFLTDMFVPWHLNFFVGWKEYERRGGSVQWIRYEDLIDDEESVVTTIVRAAGLSVDNRDVAAAVTSARGVRLNVGVSGRGESILEAHPTASSTVERYLSYYPHIDFSAIL